MNEYERSLRHRLAVALDSLPITAPVPLHRRASSRHGVPLALASAVAVVALLAVTIASMPRALPQQAAATAALPARPAPHVTIARNGVSTADGVMQRLIAAGLVPELGAASGDVPGAMQANVVALRDTDVATGVLVQYSSTDATAASANVWLARAPAQRYALIAGTWALLLTTTVDDAAWRVITAVAAVDESDAIAIVTKPSGVVARVDRVAAAATSYSRFLASHARAFIEPNANEAPVWVVAVGGELHAPRGPFTWGVFVLDRRTGELLSDEFDAAGMWPPYFDALRASH